MADPVLVVTSTAGLISNDTVKLCTGGSTTFGRTITGGVSGATYTNSWSGAASGSGTTVNFTAASAGNFTETLTISDANTGCNQTDDMKIKVVADPIIVTQPLATQSICENDLSTAINVSASGGIGTFSFQWFSNVSNSNSGGTSISGATNQNFNPPSTPAGTLFYYCVISQTGVGCSAPNSNTSEVIVEPLPTIFSNFSDTTICSGENISLVLSSGVSGTTFNWTRTNSNIGGVSLSGSVSPITGALINSTNLPQTTTFTISATSPAGCHSVSSLTVTIIVNPLPAKPIISGQNSICQGQANVLFNISNPDNTLAYHWSSNPNTVSGFFTANVFHGLIQFPPSITNAVQLFATATISATGCSNTDTFIVTVTPDSDNPPPLAIAAYFSNNPTTLSVFYNNGNTNYHWGRDNKSDFSFFEDFDDQLTQSYFPAFQPDTNNFLYWVKYWNGDHADSSCFQKAYVKANSFWQLLGVNEVAEKISGKVLIYPNPVNESSSIIIFADKFSISKVFLYDLTGKLIYKKEDLLNEHLIPLNLESSLVQGIYILKVLDNSGECITNKLIIQ